MHPVHFRLNQPFGSRCLIPFHHFTPKYRPVYGRSGSLCVGWIGVPFVPWWFKVGSQRRRSTRCSTGSVVKLSYKLSPWGRDGFALTFTDWRTEHDVAVGMEAAWGQKGWKKLFTSEYHVSGDMRDPSSYWLMPWREQLPQRSGRKEDTELLFAPYAITFSDC